MHFNLHFTKYELGLRKENAWLKIVFYYTFSINFNKIKFNKYKTFVVSVLRGEIKRNKK